MRGQPFLRVSSSAVYAMHHRNNHKINHAQPPQSLVTSGFFAAFLQSQNNHKSGQIVFMTMRAACIPC